MTQILRFYSLAYHGVLALFFLGISLVALLSGQPLQIKALPWTGDSLTHWVLGLSLFGLLSILLSLVSRSLRVLFAIWTFVVLVLMVKGLFFSSYTFANMESFKWGLALTVGAFVAFIGGLVQWRKC